MKEVWSSQFCWLKQSNKWIVNYVLKPNFYFASRHKENCYFLVQNVLMPVEFKFLEFSIAKGINHCTKFYHFGICITDFKSFCPSPSPNSLKKVHLEQDKNYLIDFICCHVKFKTTRNFSWLSNIPWYQVSLTTSILHWRIFRTSPLRCKRWKNFRQLPEHLEFG